MVLIGTAGHVDHGKSALVEALTGINPMHLPEELRRELTIELGFAHLRHPDGYMLSLVDVPGHEKLVRTMISGASGFQVALWVVDAREGLMPQSIEHLDILGLLGVPTIIPVITKADLATHDEIGDTIHSIESLALRNAEPVQIVDSITGRGIDELRRTLFAACSALGADDARIGGLPYLPVDRCFVLGGVGTVVTGTLVRGRLREGESVSVSSHPAVYRIRSLHIHNTTVAEVTAGHRTGVHLHGIKADQVQRGDCLVPPDYPYRTRRINAKLTLLPKTTFRWKPGLRALFLAGSFEMECRLWGFLESGGSVWVQIHLPREACFYPGQHFVLRSTNPLTTIGGGTVLDIAPDRPRRVTEAERDRERYFELSRSLVFESPSLAKKWMCSEESLQGAGLQRASDLIWHQKLTQSLAARLKELAVQAKGQPGEWSFLSLAAEAKVKPGHIRVLLEAALNTLDTNLKGSFALTSSTLRLDSRRGELSDEERGIAVALLRQLGAARLQPLRLAEYAAVSRVERKTFDKVVGKLLKEGSLFRVDGEFALDRSVWEEFTRQVRSMPADSFTASDFGKRFGLSRKYSVPYLECLNRVGILRRNGDRHQLRSL
jgi:selenocysteine-specific elongation factor